MKHRKCPECNAKIPFTKPDGSRYESSKYAELKTCHREECRKQHRNRKRQQWDNKSKRLKQMKAALDVSLDDAATEMMQFVRATCDDIMPPQHPYGIEWYRLMFGR